MDPLNGGTSLSPLFGRCKCPERTADGLRHKKWDVCLMSSLEFQVGSCLYVTAAVQAASHFGTAYVAAAAEVCSRFIGTCRELSPPASPSLPFLSLLFFGGFPEWKTQDHPFLSLVCPWTIVRSCLFLFSPLPFSPSLFLFFSLFPLHLPSSLGVPGCFCHSWEPFSALLLVCPWTLAS